MKKKLISIFGILAIGSFCYASNAFAGSPDSIESSHITEADGTSGQDTNSGDGIKTGHIQDGAVIDAKIDTVSMSKVTGLQAAIDAIPAGPEGPQGIAGADGVDGTDGATGPQGTAGTDGQNGTNGSNGFNGLSCWDLNGDDIADANEDVNGDGYWDTLDCRGTNGVIYLTPNVITEPFPCDTASDGAVALTSKYTLCVCDSTDWVLTVDGTTSCDWGVPTVTTATGRTWMDRNLGASQVATSYDDVAAFGDLYQWGRYTDGHQLRTSTTTLTLSQSEDPGHSLFIIAGCAQAGCASSWMEQPDAMRWQGGVSSMNNPCPDGFRIPTVAEFNAEKDTWSTNDRAGAMGSPLRLPTGGLRSRVHGDIYSVGDIGHYYTQLSGTMMQIRDNIVQQIAFIGENPGMSLRCIMD